MAENRPKLPVLLALGVAGGLLPDPAALALLLGALSSGKVMLGVITVLVFSLGFAATLVVVGIVAAKVGAGAGGPVRGFRLSQLSQFLEDDARGARGCGGGG